MTTIERLLTRWRLSTIGYFAVLFKRIPLAIDTYRQLVALAPRDRVLRSALGNLYSEAGDLEAAVQEFEQLTALAPSDADAWFNLGFLHDKRDESILSYVPAVKEALAKVNERAPFEPRPFPPATEVASGCPSVTRRARSARHAST